ncbi:hypothetical protein N7466_006821 [Penicillium verhagenii]|uniref:uncharacterized protein n=1 Tax=Penicillium verhagenii TaxID=1562060 RepID=UPI002545A76B|nr:uncharacterized protein N7466_006821 [Penicillium verhagenii]KAJ5927865.1 hypothetical protein N7466_006821 [Penicillium verhagenii]
MVGMPGRSKGCRTCRRRQCDRQEPICGQCRKACITCDGYDPPFTIHYYNGFKEKARSSPEIPDEPPNASYGAASQALSRTAYESGFEDLFWARYLPNGQSATLFDLTWRSLGGSINVLRDLLPGSRLLRTAFGALALRAAARETNAGQAMKEHGSRLHSTALRQMNKMLGPRSRNGVEALGAARIFSFYEALFGDDWECHAIQYRTWKAHQTGDLAIVLSRDPLVFSTGSAHRLFADGRLHYALNSMRARQETVLSQPRWMTEPWIHYSKTPKDLLIDILLEIPSIYVAIDKMNAEMDPDTNKLYLADVRSKVLEISQNLVDWEMKFGASNFITDSDWHFPQRTGTDEIAVAHVKSIYWAICILVSDALPTSLAADGCAHQLEPKKCCQNIIHCMPLFLHPASGIFRQHLIPFPLVTAMSYLVSSDTSGLEDEIEFLVGLYKSPDFSSMRHFISSLKDGALLAKSDRV